MKSFPQIYIINAKKSSNSDQTMGSCGILCKKKRAHLANSQLNGKKRTKARLVDAFIACLRASAVLLAHDDDVVAVVVVVVAVFSE
jgi:hypothetical protein